MSTIPTPLHNARLTSGALVSGMLLLAAHAQAESLLTYQFTNAQPTTVAQDVNGSNAAWSGFSPNVGFGGSQNSAWAWVDTNMPNTFSDSAYLSFTISAAEGYLLNLDSFTFKLGGSRNSAGADYTVNTKLRTDAEAIPYTNDVRLDPGDVVTASHTFNAVGQPTYTTYTADLSNAIYQGVESITFHLYVYRSGGTSTAIQLRLDDFDIQGSVIAVPEPSTTGLALAGLALLSAGILRKRAKR